MGSADCNQGPMPVRDDIETVSLNKSCISCEPKHPIILTVFNHGIPEKNDYNTRIIVIFDAKSRKTVTGQENQLQRGATQEKRLQMTFCRLWIRYPGAICFFGWTGPGRKRQNTKDPSLISLIYHLF